MSYVFTYHISINQTFKKTVNGLNTGIGAGKIIIGWLRIVALSVCFEGGGGIQIVY